MSLEAIDHINQEIILLLSQLFKNKHKVDCRIILDYPLSSRETDFIEKDFWQFAVSPF